MKFYTGVGDSGTTRIMGGKEIPKSSHYLKAFGDVDELNSFIGLAINESSDEKITSILMRIQDELFTLGAELSDPEGISGKKITDSHLKAMESDIAELGKDLDQSKFVLPRGNAAIFHVCRSITRRAERSSYEMASAASRKYINRLSSLFYVMALKSNNGEETHPTYQ